jgi:hypothetical protein
LAGDEELFCSVEVTGMVPELFLLPAYQGLVLSCRHIRLLLPGGLVPIDHNTPCMMPLEDI